jgi:hypothetical protein
LGGGTAAWRTLGTLAAMNFEAELLRREGATLK